MALARRDIGRGARTSILGGWVPGARTPAGIAQEVYVLLTRYQILRIGITDAIEAAGSTDPDCGSFTVALNATRDLLTQAPASSPAPSSTSSAPSAAAS